MSHFCVTLTGFFCFFGLLRCAYPPEQLHLAYVAGDDPTSMVFNWVTFDDPIVTNSTVMIGTSNDPQTFKTIVNGDSFLFTDLGSLHSTRTIHVVTVKGLDASTVYYYQVGDELYGLSAVYSFKTMVTLNTWDNNIPQKFVIYGDFGNTNAQILTSVIEEGLSDEIDTVFHVGDLAYDLYDNNGTNGDIFMNEISPLSSHVPYMVTPGNHENHYNFSHYSQRFRGIENTDGSVVHTSSGTIPNNWYYSLNIGLIHCVIISTEIYAYYPGLVKQQWEWIKNDLITANKNRNSQPWIIVFGHRGMYCSSGGSCEGGATTLKKGINVNGTLMYGLEELFYNYSVDFYFAGHSHDYERLYDVYNNVSDIRTENMTATTYVITGAGGCREGLTYFKLPQPEWSAVRISAYSYTRFYIYNKTHIHMQQIMAGNYTLLIDKDTSEQISVKENEYVIDDVWYIQYNHNFNDNKRKLVKNKFKKKIFRKTYGLPNESGDGYDPNDFDKWVKY